MDFFATLGYPGLFIAAFLAATILPLSSEIVLSALILSNLSPTLLILTATVGNVLGSFSNYILGYWFGMVAAKKWLKLSDQGYAIAEHRFKKYGIISLCFAWVPIIGDPLTVVAGVLRVPISLFLVLVTLGKLARYIIIYYLVIQTNLSH